jgi:cytochrome P450
MLITRLAAQKTAASRPRSIDDLASPPGWPLLGQLLHFDPLRAHAQFELWARELGTPFRLQLGPGYTAVVFDDVDLCHEISRARPHRYTRSGRIQPVAQEMGFNGLFSVEGVAWEAQRKLIVQTLNATHFKTWFATLSAITQRLYRRWQQAAQQGTVLEMTQELKRYTVDVTSALAFGEDPDTISQSSGTIQPHLELIFPAMMKRVMTPFSYWKWFRLPADRQLDRSLAVVRGYAQACVARARLRLADAQPDAPRNALEAMLLRQTALNLSNDDVVANVFTLLLAGEDTTAHSLAWTMLYLAADLPLQQRMHAQACDAFGQTQVCPDYATLQRLEDFEHLGLEALRLRPVVPFNSFEPVEDVILRDIRVPARTKLFFINRPSLTDPLRFANPNRYDPARWWPAHNAAADAMHDIRAFMQFGAGPRVCPGPRPRRATTFQRDLPNPQRWRICSPKATATRCCSPC